MLYLDEKVSREPETRVRGVQRRRGEVVERRDGGKDGRKEETVGWDGSSGGGGGGGEEIGAEQEQCGGHTRAVLVKRK